jgi:2'-5' RNA ligase
LSADGRQPSQLLPTLAREATRRLFFALWPSQAQRDALAQAVAPSLQSCGGRAVPTHNLHVTLAFLGSVPEGRVAELDRIASRVAAALPPDASSWSVSFERLEHWARPEILVALGSEERDGVHFGADAREAQPASPPALALRLKDETAAAGFSPDLKPFRAHVTVARKVAPALAAHAIGAVQWRFDAFALVESRAHASGPLYSVIESYLLVKSGKARK